MKFWDKREKIADSIFTLILFITVIITFIQDNIKIDEKIMFFAMGFLEACLLVLLFVRSMNILQKLKEKDTVNPLKYVALFLYSVMFGVIGYNFLILRQ